MRRRRRQKIIHVNQHRIRANTTSGSRLPVLTVKEGKENNYAHEVEIRGPCRIIYRPEKPLSCGARVWIETDSDVVLSVWNESSEQVACD